MNELRPQLDRKAPVGVELLRVLGENSTADAISRLDDADTLAGLRQQQSRRQTRGAGADDEDIAVFRGHTTSSLNSAEDELR